MFYSQCYFFISKKFRLIIFIIVVQCSRFSKFLSRSVILQICLQNILRGICLFRIFSLQNIIKDNSFQVTFVSPENSIHKNDSRFSSRPFRTFAVSQNVPLKCLVAFLATSELIQILCSRKHYTVGVKTPM